MNTSEPIWHKEVISQTARETLNKILSISIINSFYLAGGTGLALNLGHRRSYDFPRCRFQSTIRHFSFPPLILHFSSRSTKKLSFLALSLPLDDQPKVFTLENRYAFQTHPSRYHSSYRNEYEQNRR